MTKSKIVLVTGATSGIGRATALYLAGQGHRVFATGRKQDLLAELQKAAGDLSLETFTLDVNDPASRERAVVEVDERTDGHGLDVLVNNAGYGNVAPMDLITDSDLRGQFETNVFGLVALTQLFLPPMRARRYGRVINVSSTASKLALPLLGIYCATKSALEALSDAWRMELLPFGVHVSLLEPGLIRSKFEATATSTASTYEAIDSPYRPAVKNYKQIMAKFYKMAPGPLCIAKAVARAIRARRPKARYVSPWYNRLLLWFAHKLPTRWLDAIIRRVMGLTAKKLGLGG